MQILRQKRNEQGEWEDFIDQMTPEEEKEFYSKEIVSAESSILELRNKRIAIEEAIDLGYAVSSDTELLADIISQLQQKALYRKQCYENIDSL